MNTTLTTTCRCCLTTNASPTDKSIEAKASRHIIAKLTYCFPDLQFDDCNDYELCVDCRSTIDTVFDFKRNIQKSNVTVTKYTETIESSDDRRQDASFGIKSEVCIDAAKDDTSSANYGRGKTDPTPTDVVENIRVIVKIEQENSNDDATDDIRDSGTIKLEFDDDDEEVVRVRSKTYECRVCRKTFGSSSHLRRHEYIHSGYKPFECDKCDYSFTFKYLLEKHRKVHEKKATSSSSSSSDDRTSVPTSSKETKLGPSERLPVEANDVSESEDEAYSLRCKQCKKIFTGLRQLKRHKTTHNAVKRYKCDTCDYECRYMYELKKHQGRHRGVRADDRAGISKRQQSTHGGGNKPFKCDACDYSSTYMYQLNRHRRTHAIAPLPLPNGYRLKCDERVTDGAERATAYGCERCDKVFRDRSNLKRHRAIHTTRKPFECERCPKRFALMRYLKRHYRVHDYRNRTIKDFLCTYCSKMFDTAYALKKHERVHTGERPYKCTHCPKAFSSSNVLKIHTRYHTGEKPYGCATCGKRFRQGGDLSRHRLVHATTDKTNGTFYYCDACDERFTQFSSLRNHGRVHSDAKAGECRRCGKVISDRGNLARHELSHTADRPYVCNVCDKAFRQNHGLKYHVRTRHGFVPPTIDGDAEIKDGRRSVP